MKNLFGILSWTICLQAALHSSAVMAHDGRYSGTGQEILFNTSEAGPTNITALVDEVYREYEADIQEGNLADAENVLRTRLQSNLTNNKQGASISLVPGEATGIASLLARSLRDILAERSGIFPIKAPEGTHRNCIKAYDDKLKWHIDYGGGTSENGDIAFGKIVDYQLTEFATNRWSGSMNVCSWIGRANYYFVIEFPKLEKEGLVLVSKNIKGEISEDASIFLGQEMTEMFLNGRYNHKLHGKENAIVYKEVYQNSVLLDPNSDDFFKNPEDNCFDMFFINPPTGIQAEDLNDQFNYCMGRCDAALLNTGR